MKLVEYEVLSKTEHNSWDWMIPSHPNMIYWKNFSFSLKSIYNQYLPNFEISMDIDCL